MSKPQVEALSHHEQVPSNLLVAGSIPAGRTRVSGFPPRRVAPLVAPGVLQSRAGRPRAWRRNRDRAHVSAASVERLASVRVRCPPVEPRRVGGAAISERRSPPASAPQQRPSESGRACSTSSTSTAGRAPKRRSITSSTGGSTCSMYLYPPVGVTPRRMDRHVRPLTGHITVDRWNAETLDSFYARLRKCRKHCDGRRGQQGHRTSKPLGLPGHLHPPRHSSAPELWASGVDLRTVAGRLGHGGGGATTLRVNAAWRDEADSRAASVVGSRLPRPTQP